MAEATVLSNNTLYWKSLVYKSTHARIRVVRVTAQVEWTGKLFRNNIVPERLLDVITRQRTHLTIHGGFIPHIFYSLGFPVCHYIIYTIYLSTHTYTPTRGGGGL